MYFTPCFFYIVIIHYGGNTPAGFHSPYFLPAISLISHVFKGIRKIRHMDNSMEIRRMDVAKEMRKECKVLIEM